MHYFNIKFIALPIFAFGFVQSASAELADYSGTYDLQYTEFSIALNVDVAASDSEALSIPVEFSGSFDENEQLSDQAVDDMVAETLVFIQGVCEDRGGCPTLSDEAYDALYSALDAVFSELVAQINSGLDALPDIMELSILSTRTSMIEGDFADLSGATEEIVLVGTLDDASGDFSFLGMFDGNIAADSGDGWGIWSVEVDTTQEIEELQVSAGGMASLSADLSTYMEPVATAASGRHAHSRTSASKDISSSEARIRKIKSKRPSRQWQGK